jgi:hypothetical protein
VLKKALKSSWFQLAILFLIGLGIIISPLAPKNHSVQEVAIALALPMILFDTVVPYIVFSLLCAIPLNNTQPQQQVLPFKAYPRRDRIIAISTLTLFIGVFFFFLAALSLATAAFLYPLLGIDWAVQPVRHLALWFLASALTPAIIIGAYLAGIVTARYSRNVRELAKDQLSFLAYLTSRVLRSNLI